VLPRNHRQEALSRAYVEIIAAQCGMVCEFPQGRDYGIDLTLREIQRRRHRYGKSGFSLDVQAKSTAGRNFSGPDLLFDLPVKNYDDLRQIGVGCPRILVVLVVPDAVNQWTTQTEDRLTLRYCAYWLSLLGWAPTPNRRTVRVAVPRANIFSAKALPRLMERVKRGEPL
jgi:Domain of unknown function (DUF4365)